MSYVLFTVFYAFCGWLIEVSFYYYKTKTFVNRGILFGPFVPIYGLSMVSLALIFDPLFQTITWGSLIILFLTLVVVSTLFELIGGWMLWSLFDTRWWDYSNEKFHYNGFICLRFSILWGVMGTVSYTLVHRGLIKPFITTQSPEVLQAFGVFFIMILTVDYGFTLFSLLNFRALIAELRALSSRFRKQLPELVDIVPEPLLLPLERVKESERFSHLRQRYEAIKSRLSQFKNERAKRDYKHLQNVANKISQTRLYRAFPNLRIRMLENAKKTKKKEDDTL